MSRSENLRPLDGASTPANACGVPSPGSAGGPARTVLVAGRHALVRAALHSVLTRKGLEVVAEAEDAAAAAAAAARTRPALCLLDVSIPGGDVLAVRSVRAHAPETLVIVVAPVLEPERLIAALRAGASGYLTQELDADGLARAIDAALAGQAVIPRAAVRALIEQVRRSRNAGLPRGGVARSLTRREREVEERVRDGLSRREIAEELELSPVTVRRHHANIVRKAGRLAAAVDAEQVHGRIAVLHPELPDEEADVAAHGDRGDAEPVRDLGGGAALAQQLADLPLAR